MVANSNWIELALSAIETLKIEHSRFLRLRNRIISSLRAIWPGELIVLVGPSRVGKSRTIRDALGIPENNQPAADGSMRTVMVEAENASKNGEFSTKAFMAACLKAIQHPIYGVMAEDDPWGAKLDRLIHNTSEGTLRSAFERALELRQTEYWVVDEAHHVRYIPGGDKAATKVLDSWKCLASKTKIKLVLAGSYGLLPLIGLAPHLIGRQQTLSFDRYRAVSRTEVDSWEQILREFSKFLRFRDGESLSTWNRLLFEGSLGCVGLLSQWLRACLARVDSDDIDVVTREVLEATRTPEVQERELLAEILLGEEDLKRAGKPAPPTVTPSGKASSPAGPAKSTKKPVEKLRKRLPFQRRCRRHAAGGRV